MKIPDTPYLAIDKSILARNISRMAIHLAREGITLRPHVKTHKIIEIGKMQIAQGASGITVATIGEAEVFARRGFKDILIAYPIWASDEKLKRLARLARKIKLTLAVDSVAGARQLSNLQGIDVLVEIDSGHHRSGCEPSEAGRIGLAVKELGLVPKGIFTFPGHSYKPRGISSAVKDEAKALRIAVSTFKENGLEPEVVSSGSTPSAKVTPGGLVTELRPGVYVFNDAQQLELGVCKPKDIALWANATVVSATGNKIIVDAGSKLLGADKASWATGYGRLLDYPDARVTALSEHHATVSFPTKNAGGRVRIPKLGTVIRLVPNHVCNAVNLSDSVFVFEKSKVMARWKVAARGQNS